MFHHYAITVLMVINMIINMSIIISTTNYSIWWHWLLSTLPSNHGWPHFCSANYGTAHRPTIDQPLWHSPSLINPGPSLHPHGEMTTLQHRGQPKVAERCVKWWVSSCDFNGFSEFNPEGWVMTNDLVILIPVVMFTNSGELNDSSWLLGMFFISTDE